MSFYGLLADGVVVIHLAYVSFVVLSQLLIWLGWALGWSFARNRWFRSLHLLAIAIVVFEALLNIDCPLTVWDCITGALILGTFVLFPPAFRKPVILKQT